MEHLMKHCTSCHLCVSRCPSNVLKPSLLEYGIGGIMQPVMSFDRGYCNYNCTVCTEVCPNGALHALTMEEKHQTQVGRVVFNQDICVVHTDGTNCGACAEHCPTQAVTMVPYKDGLTIPHTDTEICVGCGGCEFICPVRPHTAIYVEGNPIHLKAKAFKEAEKSDVVIDDFGF
jgi:ferredoxin